jgi:quinol monooxygenase YgiN
MAVLSIARFKADPGDTEELLARRATLIAATRAKFPGLNDARLARLDEETWVDVWEWDSQASLQTALAGAHDLPEVMAAFALTRDATQERGEVVDTR